MKKLCFVATIPAVVHSFLKDHIRASAEQWSVKIISSAQGAELLNSLSAQFMPLEIERKISLWRDLSALVKMVFIFRRERFDLVHSIMPKTGLLAMLAAWTAGVPNRLHTFTGQFWSTKQGWKRISLKLFDRLIVLFATHILVDSPSQLDFLITESIVSRDKAQVLGCGSICGVDSRKFRPDPNIRNAVRKELGIDEEQIVILFLGRLNRDKGILDLATAFAGIAANRSDVLLVLVGAEEDVPFTRVQEICHASPHLLRRASFTTEPERYLAMSDIFCLPSYREGFGQVIIEAAAAGIPAVATRIYGIVDAIVEGETGLLFAAGDVSALMQCLLMCIEDKNLRRQMGEAARARAIVLFSSQRITGELLELYVKLLDKV